MTSLDALTGSFQWIDRLRNEMNKTELIDKVASSAQVSRAEASRVFNAIMDTITDSLSIGESVTIVGFGTFKVADRAERSGRNPQTGQIIKIKAQKTPRFSAGKQLKQACNAKEK
jgi:DNA-binding protein HU-beta